MPSAAGGHAVVKLVTVGGQPRIQGVCVVFDATTLAPVALVDGIALTNVRTPAVSALAVRRLAAPDARRLLVFGRGPQAHGHVEAIRAVRPIEHVDMVGRDGRGVEERSAPPTSSAAPRPRASRCSTGRSWPTTRRSWPSAPTSPRRARPTTRSSGRATVVVESRLSALREAGDVIGAIASGALGEDSLVTLADWCAGGRRSLPARGLFKSTGMAWEDAVVASALVR